MEKTKILHPSAHRHWHFLYKHRKRSTSASTKQIIAGQIFTVVMSIGAGLWLDHVKYSIVAFAGALLLLPGIVNLAGSLAGALGAKINHLLEEKEHKTSKIIVGAVLHALLISLLTGLLVGAIGGLIGEVYFKANFASMLQLMILTMTLIGVVIYPVVSVLVVVLRRFKLNPDNLVGPIQSSLVDVLSIVMIAVAIGVLS